MLENVQEDAQGGFGLAIHSYPGGDAEGLGWVCELFEAYLVGKAMGGLGGDQGQTQSGSDGRQEAVHAVVFARDDRALSVAGKPGGELVEVFGIVALAIDEHGLTGQVGGRDLGSAGEGMVTVDGQLPGSPDERGPVQGALARVGSDADGDVEFAVVEAGEHFGGGEVEEFDAGARMVLGEGGDGGREESGGKGGGVANAQAGTDAGGADAFEEEIGAMQKFAGFEEKGFASGGEADGMGLAFEEGLADVVFEGFDLSAEGGLGEEDGPGGAGDVSGFSDGDEVAQLAQFHGRQCSEWVV